MNKKLLLVFGALLVLISAFACASTTLAPIASPTIPTMTSTPITIATQTPTITPTQTPILTSTPTSTPLAFETIIIKGADDMTTAPFSIPTKEWEIRWSYEPSDEYNSFGFFVYPRGEPMLYIESVLFPSTLQGTTYIYQGHGDFYLKIDAYGLSSYRFEIQPKP